jgi:hypothetical protein
MGLRWGVRSLETFRRLHDLNMLKQIKRFLNSVQLVGKHYPLHSNWEMRFDGFDQVWIRGSGIEVRGHSCVLQKVRR